VFILLEEAARLAELFELLSVHGLKVGGSGRHELFEVVRHHVITAAKVQALLHPLGLAHQVVEHERIVGLTGIQARHFR
jgi:hypothetical protein